MDLRIKCPIVGEDLPKVEAQAFRILNEVGDEFFLDFLQANPVAGFRVVMRLRVPKGTLVAILDRLVNDVVEFTSGTVH